MSLKSKFICAGFESLSECLDSYIKKNGDDVFRRDKIANFFETTVSGFLHSFGTAISGKNGKLNKKTISSQVSIFKKARSTHFFDRSLFYVDSGGYQISAGFFDRNQTEDLIKIYHDFLRNDSDVFDRAFVLDITPGPNDKVFRSESDIYDYNLRTYSLAKELPTNIRKKMVYIHHFRTPSLWRAFKRILTDDMFLSFENFATGGIVASSKSDVDIPCIIYVLPLVVLLNKTIAHNKKRLCFHILGGANFRDIFFYELMAKHVKRVHDVDLVITYDSSALFKGFLMSRRLPVLVDGVSQFVSLRSSDLSFHTFGKRTNKDMILDSVNEMAKEFSMKQLDGNLYDSENKTLLPVVSLYGMLYYLYYYYKAQNYIRKQVDLIYRYYESGEIAKFSQECLDITQKLNGDKITRKQRVKTNCSVNSLKMLSTLDEDFCEYIVYNLLVKDEFTHINNSTRVLTF